MIGKNSVGSGPVYCNCRLGINRVKIIIKKNSINNNKINKWDKVEEKKRVNTEKEEKLSYITILAIMPYNKLMNCTTM